MGQIQIQFSRAVDSVIAHNDPAYQEKLIKFNQLLANYLLTDTTCEVLAGQ